MDDRNENNGRTASTTGTRVETSVSVQSSRPLQFPIVSQNLPPRSESPVLSSRGEASATFARVSRAIPLPTPSGNSQISPPCDRLSVSRGLVSVPSKKSSVVSRFQRCLRVSHLFGVPSPRKVNSTNRTHIAGIFRAPTSGTCVVGKIATAARMMRLYVLMVGATSCLDQVVHASPVADAIPISCPCVEIFHVDPRDNVEQRVRQNNLRGPCAACDSCG